MSTTRSFRVLATLTLALITVVALAAVIFANRATVEDQPSGLHIPACELEDGSTQQVCYWHDGSGEAVINLDWGGYSYSPESNTFTDYSK